MRWLIALLFIAFAFCGTTFTEKVSTNFLANGFTEVSFVFTGKANLTENGILLSFINIRK